MRSRPCEQSEPGKGFRMGGVQAGTGLGMRGVRMDAWFAQRAGSHLDACDALHTADEMGGG